jgi:hypothetical protein
MADEQQDPISAARGMKGCKGQACPGTSSNDGSKRVGTGPVGEHPLLDARQCLEMARGRGSAPGTEANVS